VVDAWLADQGAGLALRRSVSALVGAHEWGGWAQADLLQAADSISFLAVNADSAWQWMRDHGHSPQRIAEQFAWMYSRIVVGTVTANRPSPFTSARDILAGAQARASPATSQAASGSPGNG
jgi:hypothetical protein